MVWLLAILLVVLLVGAITIKGSLAFLSPDSEVLEKTWTLIPITILITIAFPRIHLLCLQDSFSQEPNSRIKIIRNQWNWQRESSAVFDHLLDSDLVDFSRAYDSPILSEQGSIRVLLTSTDVLHSLGFPRLGVKLDSSPGRLNTTIMEILRPGIFVGSCYELCGRGHRAMPIKVLVL